MALAYSDFVAEFPTLATTNTTELAQIAAILNRVEVYLIPATATGYWGSSVTLARLLLAAHIYVTTRGNRDNGNDAVGPLISRTTDDGSVSFGGLTTGTDSLRARYLGTSSYGLQLLDLRKTRRGYGIGGVA